MSSEADILSGSVVRGPGSGESSRRGLLLVVSAPSGTGKTTVAERLVQVVPDLALSRSYTSRAIRAGEVDGIDYNFITRARFEQMVAAGAFLEFADVFGNLYGTCAGDAEAYLAAGRDLVLVIDVQGARQVRSRCAGTVGVFVLPPSFPILEQRLRGRSSDTEEAMQRRLQTARDEVAAFTEYDYVVVNDELEACVDRLKSIVLAERARLRSMRGVAEEIVKTFIGNSRRS
ncbi:MAG TPA: guanylate kinase [Vicinamibacterales bacterium]|jgi:guanylate kinase|nr:guanylate kinase [Vicinamibacterales bacterium]